MKAHILTIGDELLIGQIIDTNAAWMGEYLTQNGVVVVGSSSTADEEESIRRAIDHALETADVILMSGGLGPTKDDITKKTLAEYFGLSMYFHEKTFENLTKIFARFGRSTTEAHKAQCYMPEGALIMENKRGTAPGMWFEKEDKVLVSMPGVPYEMKYLIKNEVLPKLLQKFKVSPSLYKTIQTAGEGESRLAARIGPYLDQLPKHLSMAYLPNLGKVRLRLGIKGTDLSSMRIELDDHVRNIVKMIPELVFGYDKDSLESVLLEVFKKNKLTLSTAESCTGGHLSHKIVSVPGSSAYFLGGLVAYSNEIKHQELKVKQETLQDYGAVSEETVREMVKGALKAFESDISVAISGIAGPTGGTEEKPVGTIWLAMGNNSNIRTYKLQLGKERLKNIEYTSNFALNKLRHFVLKNYSQEEEA